MIDPKQLRAEVIRPVLEHLGLGGDAAEELLLGTAIQESRCGTYLRQLGGGPALGVFQMEPATHDDIWDNYLRYQLQLAGKVGALLAPWPDRAPQLVGNLAYATAMARVHYRRVPAALPAAGDLLAQARYWKRWYNTPLGAGTPEEYIAAWRRFFA